MLVALLLSCLLATLIVTALNLKAVYVHYGDQKKLVYVWLKKVPQIKCSGNSYKERKGRDIHVYCRDSSARITIIGALDVSYLVYILGGKICVLN